MHCSRRSYCDRYAIYHTFFMVMCAIILRRNSKTKGRGDSVIN
ncbi:hypothetical protein STM14_3815 [Salmonella enterica subsp. enterica serovar Typhimurium str. 14028S]|uniref:Uncharacterized protein n=2 Tax=Salmonella enterica I TaxID=59201 RepID=A0A0F6B6S1_SALT1|nr:hypothetical protein SPAB_03933 [Salmonella enterica subsp. enterica serovar Paratyphi B str. SPB7]ACY90218.1 hypothetical protein STM14_3815 [Salmonella enterica subsp. enterica serovar Typhimurium str. 14028S]